MTIDKKDKPSAMVLNAREQKPEVYAMSFGARDKRISRRCTWQITKHEKNT